LNFLKVKKINLPEQIANSLRELIIGGKIKSYERLPSERDLAKRFGTNRNTLREALKILERDGLIRIRQGGGVDVMDFNKDGKIDLLSAIIRNTQDISIKANIILDALMVRSAGLSEISRIAAMKRKEENLTEIKNALLQIQNNIGTDDHKLVYDTEMQFLKAIVEASSSLVLIWFFNTIKEIMDDAFVEFGTYWNITKEYFHSISKIYRAIEKGNPDQAYQATREHFENMDKKLVKLFKEVKNA